MKELKMNKAKIKDYIFLYRNDNNKKVKYLMNRDRSGWGCGFYDIDPLHVCGNAANLEYKTKEMFASVKKYLGSILQIGCIPTDVQGVYFPNSKDLLAVIIVVTSNGLVQFLFYLFVFYFSLIHLCVDFCCSLKICICTLY